MATEQRMHLCKRCSKATLHVRSSTSHVLHFLLSIPTLGLWTLVWIFMALFHKAQSECTSCGKNRLALFPTLALLALIMPPIASLIGWNMVNESKSVASPAKETQAKQSISHPQRVSDPRPADDPGGVLRGEFSYTASPEPQTLVTSPPQPETYAQAAARKKRNRATQLALAGAAALKKAMRDPESFKLESALQIESTGAVCYEYRSKNGFRGVNVGQAVLSADAKNFKTNEEGGFTTLWNKECANRTGKEVAAGFRWFLP